LRKAFAAWDTTKTGLLNYKQFQSALKHLKISTGILSESGIMNLFNEVKDKEKGLLNYNDFLLEVQSYEIT